MAKKVASLGRQAHLALKQADGIGQSKHVLKKEGSDVIKVHSFNYKNDLYRMSKEFTSYLKTDAIDENIRYLKDIKSDHVTAFLDSKASTCKQSTLDKYRSNIAALGIIFSQKYKTIDPNSFKCERVVSRVGDKPDRSMFTANQVTTFLESFKDDRSYEKNLHIAVFLGAYYGLRVHEIVALSPQNINLDALQLRLIHTKGGRPRTLSIKPEHRRDFALIKERSLASGKVVGYKSSKSLNTALYRLKNKLFNPADMKNKSFHSFRKFAAQDRFDEYRLQGDSVDVALGKVSEFLGHNFDRDRALIKVYVGNIW